MENLTFSVHDIRKAADNPDQWFRVFLHKCYIKTKADFGVEVFKHRPSQASNNSHAITNLATLAQDRQLRPFYTPESTALASVLVQTTIQILHNFLKTHTINAISLSSFPPAHIAHRQPTLKLSVLYILTAPNLGRREFGYFSARTKPTTLFWPAPGRNYAQRFAGKREGLRRCRCFMGVISGRRQLRLQLERGEMRWVWKRVGSVTVGETVGEDQTVKSRI